MSETGASPDSIYSLQCTSSQAQRRRVSSYQKYNADQEGGRLPCSTVVVPDEWYLHVLGVPNAKMHVGTTCAGTQTVFAGGVGMGKLLVVLRDGSSLGGSTLALWLRCGLLRHIVKIVRDISRRCCCFLATTLLGSGLRLLSRVSFGLFACFVGLAVLRLPAFLLSRSRLSFLVDWVFGLGFACSGLLRWRCFCRLFVFSLDLLAASFLGWGCLILIIFLVGSLASALFRSWLLGSSVVLVLIVLFLLAAPRLRDVIDLHLTSSSSLTASRTCPASACPGCSDSSRHPGKY